MKHLSADTYSELGTTHRSMLGDFGGGTGNVKFNVKVPSLLLVPWSVSSLCPFVPAKSCCMYGDAGGISGSRTYKSSEEMSVIK